MSIQDIRTLIAIVTAIDTCHRRVVKNDVASEDTKKYWCGRGNGYLHKVKNKKLTCSSDKMYIHCYITGIC